MINLPNNFINDLTGVMGDTFSDLMPLILFMIGISIGVYIISNLFWNWKERDQEDYFKNKR